MLRILMRKVGQHARTDGYYNQRDRNAKKESKAKC